MGPARRKTIAVIKPSVACTNSISPLDGKTATPLGNAVEPRRNEAGRGKEEKAKNSGWAKGRGGKW